MEEFLGWARKTIQDQFDFLSDCKRCFAALVNYSYPGNGGVVSPSEFFELWTEMCNDFKEAWKVEQQIVVKEVYEKKSSLEWVNVNKSLSSSSLKKKMLTSQGPFLIKKRRSTNDFQKVRDTTVMLKKN